MKILLAAIVASSASAAFAQAPPPGAVVLAYTCGSPELMTAAATAQLAKSATPDLDLAAANKAIDLGRAQHANALGGQPGDEVFGSARRFGELAKAASDPEIADLYRRAARDQLYRNTFTAAIQRTSWAAGLSDVARAYAYQILAGEGCGVDEDNRSWLRSRVALRGWFKISTSGADADRAAFLLIQHADRDPAFQSEVLSLLKPLALAGETKPSNFALLFDRVAVKQRLPQKYGTQGRCLGTGWSAFDTEDTASLDERRASVGLPPQAEYVLMMSKRCPPSPN